MRDTALSAAAYDLFISVLDFFLLKRWRRLLWSQVEGPLVLEAGVGSGLNINYYRRDYRVTALDRADRFLSRARRRAARQKNIKVEFIQGDVHSLPFSDASYDTVVASFLFCSLDDPLQGMRELQRVLKPGGVLLLLEHCRSQGLPGRAMDILAVPLYRLSGDHIARDTGALAGQVGFERISSRPLLLDLVKLIRAEKKIIN